MLEDVTTCKQTKTKKHNSNNENNKQSNKETITQRNQPAPSNEQTINQTNNFSNNQTIKRRNNQTNNQTTKKTKEETLYEKICNSRSTAPAAAMLSLKSSARRAGKMLPWYFVKTTSWCRVMTHKSRSSNSTHITRTYRLKAIILFAKGTQHQQTFSVMQHIVMKHAYLSILESRTDQYHLCM